MISLFKNWHFFGNAILKNERTTTVISSINYDADSNTLRIIFVSGMIYNYKNVPEGVYHYLKIIGAKGIFLNQNIEGKLQFEK